MRKTSGKLEQRVILQDHQHSCNHHHRDVQKNGSSQEEPRDTAIHHVVFKMGCYVKEKVVKFLNDHGLIEFTTYPTTTLLPEDIYNRGNRVPVTASL